MLSEEIKAAIKQAVREALEEDPDGLLAQRIDQRINTALYGEE